MVAAEGLQCGELHIAGDVVQDVESLQLDLGRAAVHLRAVRCHERNHAPFSIFAIELVDCITTQILRHLELQFETAICIRGNIHTRAGSRAAKGVVFDVVVLNGRSHVCRRGEVGAARAVVRFDDTIHHQVAHFGVCRDCCAMTRPTKLKMFFKKECVPWSACAR